ncbi:MAG: hypothetical protein H7144_17230 [Burkholderiales bacterium]|nr:hypothetical protein [Phycisphaerae bacterium]
MNIFLDSSVLLAACGRATGASRAVIDQSATRGWTLLTSSYVIDEVEINLKKLGEAAINEWPLLKVRLHVVPDILSFHWVNVFAPAKDRPILFTAAAFSDVLLTLDRRDFGELFGGAFYGLAILKPGTFLANMQET